MNEAPAALPGKRTLRALIVEDRMDDLLLLLEELRRANYQPYYRHVQTEGELREALREDWDIVLSDFSLPSMTAHDVISIVNDVRPTLSCIVISGTITEESAVEVLRAGARDFVVKERMARLVPAIERELRESADRLRLVHSEALLRQTRERMQFALEAVGVGTWEWHIPSGEVFWSDVLERLHGLQPGTFGGTLSAFIELVHPEDQPRVLEALQRAQKERIDSRIEYRVVPPDGSVRWLVDIGRVLFDEQDAAVRAVGVGFDITAQKALQEHVRQAQKMESIGNLAGGIAHDFNNLLTVIAGECDLMASSVDPDSEAAVSLEAIRTAAKSASALTRQLLTFSRRQVVVRRLLDINRAIKGFATILRRLVEENVAIEFNLGATQAAVCIDPGQLEQLLLNLVANARDAMPNGGRITISTSEAARDRAIEVPGGKLAAGSYVVLSVADTGSGMSPEVQAHLFEPFFTTKGVGRGTGLGLATVHGIVTQSEGQIFVETAPGAGTTFRIYLPVASKTADDVSEPSPSPASPEDLDGAETILLVEDNAALRRLTERILRARGYTVLSAASAAQAMELCASHGNEIALVLTDIVMPDESGHAVADLVLQQHPDVTVIYMSGYTADSDRIPKQNFLQKPFAATQLLSMIRTTLGRRRS